MKKLISKSSKMRGVFFIIIAYWGLYCVPSYSQNNSGIIFRYEKDKVIRCVSLLGYDYACSGNYNEFRCNSPLLVDSLFKEMSQLKVDTTMTNYIGIDVDIQLIYHKEGYGYDVLNLTKCGESSFIELNGKPQKTNSRLADLILSLEDYHRIHTKGVISEEDIVKFYKIYNNH